MRIVTLNEGAMKNLLEEMLKRDPNNYESYTETVQSIVDQVKARGDEALFAFTKEFDKAEVSAETVRAEARGAVPRGRRGGDRGGLPPGKAGASCGDEALPGKYPQLP